MSFSLTSFAASYSTLVYENINSIKESFVASFLSHCGLDVKFFNWDNDYSGSEFKNAAWCNLTRSFLNYIDNNDFKLSDKILDYASSCGIDSSIHGSSFVWDGSFKDCREIVDQLIYHLYNYLSPYENVYGFVDVPLSMYIGEDEEKYTGCYSRVDFPEAISLSDWYTNVGQSIQSYCTGNYVDDDFAGCNISYYWDYNKLPLGYDNYVRVLDTYIDNYKKPSGGDSSGSDSSNDSSDTSSDTSSDDGDSLGLYYDNFFYHFSYSILSTFDLKIFSNSSDTKYVVDELISLMWDYVRGEISCNYISTRYPDIYTDFVNIANYEYSNYTSLSSTKVYQIDFFATDYHRRFVYGFLELFDSYILRGDTSYGTSSFKHCTLFDFNELTAIFSYGGFEDIDSNSRYYYWQDGLFSKYFNFITTYDGSTSVSLYYDVSNYFIENSFNSTSYLVFAGYNLPSYHSNLSSDSPYYWPYDPNAIYESIEDITINHIIIPTPDVYGISNYLFDFFNNAANCFSFLFECFTLLPSEVIVCFYGGFVLVFCFSAIKLLF